MTDKSNSWAKGKYLCRAWTRLNEQLTPDLGSINKFFCFLFFPKMSSCHWWIVIDTKIKPLNNIVMWQIRSSATYCKILLIYNTNCKPMVHSRKCFKLMWIKLWASTFNIDWGCKKIICMNTTNRKPLLLIEKSSSIYSRTLTDYEISHQWFFFGHNLV